MTFQKYWEAMVTRNPDLADPEKRVNIPVPKFKQALQQAFEKGAEKPSTLDISPQAFFAVNGGTDGI